MRLSVRHGNNRTRKRGRRLRVLLNGQDVTAETFELDTREGWVMGYATLPTGGKYFDRSGKHLAVRRRHGRVRIERLETD